MTRRVIVVGGGISGLTCAWVLQKDPKCRVTLLEASGRIGGWIETLQQDGFLFELGPRGCRPRGAGVETLRLIEELGLQSQVVFSAPSAQNRYLWMGNRLRKTPSSLLALLSSPLASGMGRALWRDWTSPATAEADESIGCFMRRRIGPAWTERWIDLLVKGIFAGDIDSLSMRSCFPTLWQWEQEAGSLLRGWWKSPKSPALPDWAASYRDRALFTFQEGMEALPRAMAKQFQGTISLHSSVRMVQRKGNEWKVELESGQSLFADELHLHLPFPALAKILQASGSPPPPELPYASLLTIHLGFHSYLLPKQGFGYLVPRSEKQPLLGMIWDSQTFPSQNSSPEETRLTLMCGGMENPKILDLDDLDLLALAKSVLDRHLGIRQNSDFCYIHRANQAIPQFPVGYFTEDSRWRRQIRDWGPHLYIGEHPVGVNECIALNRKSLAKPPSLDLQKRMANIH